MTGNAAGSGRSLRLPSQRWMRQELAGLAARLEGLDQQILRAGKEQFRSNALTEATQRQLGALLETFTALDQARTRELESAREALSGARTAGRVAFFTRFLPAMDSLDEALASGARQLAGWGVLEAETAPLARLPAGLRLRQAWRLLRGSWSPWELQESPRQRLRPEALGGWLRGLELLRERLLEHFAEEDIRPMETLGANFDPHQHLAFDSVRADARHPPGSIVRQVRPGYLMGETVLRYAEVVVAK